MKKHIQDEVGDLNEAIRTERLNLKQLHARTDFRDPKALLSVDFYQPRIEPHAPDFVLFSTTEMK